jgi:hypothetical protein
MPDTLPVSSGTSDTNKKINDVNLQIQTLISQSQANTLYDPKPPPYETHSQIKKTNEGFVGGSSDSVYLAAAIGLIILGFVLLSKKTK